MAAPHLSAGMPTKPIVTRSNPVAAALAATPAFKQGKALSPAHKTAPAGFTPHVDPSRQHPTTNAQVAAAASASAKYGPPVIRQGTVKPAGGHHSAAVSAAVIPPRQNYTGPRAGGSSVADAINGSSSSSSAAGYSPDQLGLSTNAQTPTPVPTDTGLMGWLQSLSTTEKLALVGIGVTVLSMLTRKGGA